MTVFGPMTSPAKVAAAVRDLLRVWLPDYLAEYEAQLEDEERPHDYYDRPADADGAYRVVASLNSPVWGQTPLLPRVAITSSGTDELYRDAEGYTATIPVTVRVAAGARDQEATLDVASAYITAIVCVILDHADLDGLASGVTWTAETTDDGPVERERTLALASATFTFTVEQYRQPNVGPDSPTPRPDPSEPYPDAPDVVSATAELHPL